MELGMPRHVCPFLGCPQSPHRCTDHCENEGGASGGAAKALGLLGGKGGLSGLNRWTGLKKGLFSVRTFRKEKMTKVVRLKSACMSAAFYVLLFQHQPVSVKTFSMFKCQTIEDEEYLYTNF